MLGFKQRVKSHAVDNLKKVIPKEVDIYVFLSVRASNYNKVRTGENAMQEYTAKEISRGTGNGSIAYS